MERFERFEQRLATIYPTILGILLLDNNHGIFSHWAFFALIYGVYRYSKSTSPQTHQSLQTFPSSLSEFGDATSEIFLVLFVGSFFILGFYLFWKTTLHNGLLEEIMNIPQTQEENDEIKLRRRLDSIEQQRRRAIANGGERQRERAALENAGQRFVDTYRLTAQNETQHQPEQQKPSQWAAAAGYTGYITGRLWGSKPTHKVPRRVDHAAWLDRTRGAGHQQPANVHTQREPEHSLANFLQIKDAERQRLGEAIHRRVNEPDDRQLFGNAGQPPGGTNHSIPQLRSTIPPPQPSVLPSSQLFPAPTNPTALTPAVISYDRGGGAFIRQQDRIVENRLFTPHQQRELAKINAATAEQRYWQNWQNYWTPLAQPQQASGITHGPQCSCGLTPFLGPHLPGTNPAWPTYPVVHQANCPKSPYFRRENPTPAASGNGLTPLLPMQAGPSTLIGDVHTSPKTKFANTKGSRLSPGWIGSVGTTLGNIFNRFGDTLNYQNNNNINQNPVPQASDGQFKDPNQLRDPAMPSFTELDNWEKQYYLPAKKRAEKLREAEKLQEIEVLNAQKANIDKGNYIFELERQVKEREFERVIKERQDFEKDKIRKEKKFKKEVLRQAEEEAVKRLIEQEAQSRAMREIWSKNGSLRTLAQIDEARRIQQEYEHYQKLREQQLVQQVGAMQLDNNNMRGNAWNNWQFPRPSSTLPQPSDMFGASFDTTVMGWRNSAGPRVWDTSDSSDTPSSTPISPTRIINMGARKRRRGIHMPFGSGLRANIPLASTGSGPMDLDPPETGFQHPHPSTVIAPPNTPRLQNARPSQVHFNIPPNPHWQNRPG